MRQSSCKWKSACCAAVIAAALSAQAAMAQAPIVISQLFGGSGGNAAAANGDFIEIFNRSCVAVNLDGYSVQVASGGSGATWQVIPLPNFQLDPGRYYCIRLTTTAVGTAFAQDLTQTTLTPSGDLMLSSSGKAAIVLGDLPITGACPAAASVVDFAKYEGTATACTEGLSFGVALGGTAAGRSVSRKLDVNADGQGDGCQDTNVNNNDFMSDVDPCVPRTNATAANVCPGAPIFGGCNLGDGSCRVTPGAGACATLGGSYLGDCTPCVAPQACCLPTSPVTCVVESQLECEIDGGVFNPGQFACPPSPACPVLGRCCSPDGTCIQTFSVLCVSPNVYGGDGTNCTGTPCQGRCCGLDGTCTVVGPDQCVAPSVFAGLGTDCAQPETCQGRCCAPDGTCTLTGSSNCVAPNTFGGVGTNCQNVHVYSDPNPPTVAIPGVGTAPPSIITVPDNFNMVDVDVRVKIQHTFRADVVICLTGPGGSPTVALTQAASCTTGGLCGGEDNLNAIFNDEGLPVVCASVNLASLVNPPDQVIPGQSLSAFDGLPSAGDWTLNIVDDLGGDSGTLLEWALLLDDGNACQGACCRANGSCFITGQLPCQQQGGVFHGAGVSCSPSPCAPNGACCVGATCSQQSAIDCAANGGVFGGVNSSCTNAPCFVPCCKPDGTCQLLTTTACAAIQFATAGAPGTPCPPAPCAPIGACCFADGTCQATLTELACTGQGGVRWRQGQGCTPNGCQGRCCSLTGECSVTFPAQCVAPNLYGGDGTDCTDPLGCQGRCCGTDGSCTLTGPAACPAPSVFAGVGTSCGDGSACSGRCCLSNGTCSVQTISGCAGQGGTLTLGLDCTAVTVVTFDNLGIALLDSPATETNVQVVSGLPTPISDVNVDFFAQHTFFADLVITVEHNGTVVSLTDGLQACFGDNPDIVLDDEGTGGAIEALTCPSGIVPTSPPNYTPLAALSAFDGMDPNGPWTISVHDDAGIDTGTLVRWSLHIATEAPVCPVGGCTTCRGDVNGDNVVNGKDIKLFAQCVAGGGAGCPCADMDNNGTANSADVAAFIARVMLGGNCP